MRLHWRLLLVWLMALALPVQGLATAGSLHCSPPPARVHMQAQAMPAAAAQGSAHAHLRTHAQTPAHAAGHHGSPGAAHEHGHGGHTCSACAACCPAIGQPGRAVDLPSAPLGGFAADTVQAASPSFVPSGLERPPRA